MKVKIGKYKEDAEAVYCILKLKDGTYDCVCTNQKNTGENIDMRSRAMCEIVDFMRQNGMTDGEIIASNMAAVIL